MLTITRDLAFDAGRDAGNRRMRAAGRTSWDMDDRDHAISVTNALLLHVPHAAGGLAGLRFTDEMMAGLGITADQVRRSGNIIEA